jgi:4-alpha-glucanotransferase
VVARPQLHALARAHGIEDGYQATTGRHCVVSDATREALLAALGVEASSEDAAARSLERHRSVVRARLVDVISIRRPDRAGKLVVRTPLEWEGRRIGWKLALDPEAGERLVVEGQGRATASGALALACPAPGIGVLRAKLELECEGECREAAQWVFAPPPACVKIEERLGQPRAFGFWAHVYALSRATDFGIGDLAHLEALVRVASEERAAFVAIQPLHALAQRGDEASPYSPVSRLFRDPMHLDLAAIPEWTQCELARSAVQALEASGRLGALRRASTIDYAAVRQLKRRLLEPLYAEFCRRHGSASTERGRAHRAFVDREGDALRGFATYIVLSESFEAERTDDNRADAAQADWRAWPEAFRDPESPAVRDFVSEHAREIDFQCWLQFEIDHQVGLLGDKAKQALGLGLIGDLAIGSGRSSADAWLHRDRFVAGANLGAPPDAFADGQDWSLPPLHPERARQDGHAYWRRVVRCAFGGMGALRIDHVMGLFRQFWIPAGRPPAEGAYVTMPSHEYLALLAIESHRARAGVVGEDLGTRPPALAPRLARAGILSMRVLPFERTRTGSFRSAAEYGDRAYVTAHTHDMPPLLGWCEGRDLELRHASGELTGPGELADARREREEAVAALERRLGREPGAARVDDRAGREASPIAVAATAFLASTQAPLLALSVDDLVGEREPLNLPGIENPPRPNWSHRMKIEVEALRDGELASRILDVLPPTRRLARGPTPD